MRALRDGRALSANRARRLLRLRRGETVRHFLTSSGYFWEESSAQFQNGVSLYNAWTVCIECVCVCVWSPCRPPLGLLTHQMALAACVGVSFTAGEASLSTSATQAECEGTCSPFFFDLHIKYLIEIEALHANPAFFTKHISVYSDEASSRRTPTTAFIILTFLLSPPTTTRPGGSTIITQS